MQIECVRLFSDPYLIDSIDSTNWNRACDLAEDLQIDLADVTEFIDNGYWLWTAAEVWVNSENSVKFSTPVLKEDLILGVTETNKLFCFDAKDGKNAWEQDIDGRQGFGSVVTAGPIAMVLTPRGQLIVFEADAAGFKQLASYTVALNDPQAYPVVSGNQIYVKDEDSLTLWTVE